MAQWKDKIEVQKGDRGEEIVREYLEQCGWIIYQPVTDGAHAVDMVCIRDKKETMIAEIKTKARLNFLNATGIDVRAHDEYKRIEEMLGIDVHLFFVDEGHGVVYGNTLTELTRDYMAQDGRYPRTIAKGKIIVFSLEKMNIIKHLSYEDIEYMKSKSTRNYEYNFK